jgi:hypothetical protein
MQQVRTEAAESPMGALGKTLHAAADHEARIDVRARVAVVSVLAEFLLLLGRVLLLPRRFLLVKQRGGHSAHQPLAQGVPKK